MKTHINPKIEITKPVKNKHYGYYTEFENNTLVIKAKSKSGRSRGKVGEVKETGEIHLDKHAAKFLTSELTKKIKFLAEILYCKEIIATKIKVKTGKEINRKLVTVNFSFLKK